MKFNLFGRHLHNQIVIPLVAALVGVGVIATVVAVSLISGIINYWIDQTARSTSASVVARLEDQYRESIRGAKLASENRQLVQASKARDAAAISGQLVLANQSLKADNLMLLDDQGVVLASTGRLNVVMGMTALRPEDRRYLALQMSHPILARIGDAYTVSALEPVKGPDDTTFTLVMSTIIDDAYLTRVAEESKAVLSLYDSKGKLVAISGASALGGTDLTDVLREKPPQIATAITDASSGSPLSHRLEIGSAEYRVIAQKVTFTDDPTGSTVYLITTVGTSVANTARATTTTLIVGWSAIAVVVLVGLGWWIARSVSDPLVTLSESAARVAEGDFAAKVEIPGENEVAELAQNFNRMTDSLKDRSETLTKKVLELATLYEMSRALGATLELDTLLDSVLESARRIFDVEIGYVTMADRESGVLQVRAWQGADLSHTDEITVRKSMSEWVIREGRPLVFNPRPGSSDAEGDNVSGALAALCVPLPSSEGIIGAITVGTRDPGRRFTSEDVRLLATIANHVTIAVGNIDLFSSVQEAYLATVRALAAAVDAKDPYTRGHSDGVAAYALRIGEAMNLSMEQMTALEMAAYLHDIGKIGIPEGILLKPGKLTDEEMNQMRHHPLIGANILKPVAFPWPIAPIVRHHHEYYDGAGYPAGLKREEIPILARVITVADSFEAMVADRPYRLGRSQQEAVQELRRCSGTQFDPRVVDAFIEVLESAEVDFRGVPKSDVEVGADEAQALYMAICDGMFSGFRRLGGPRLAANLEQEVNEKLRSEAVPLVLHAGRLNSDGDTDVSEEELTDHLATALSIMSRAIERASGAGLADHFLEEAVAALPERMRLRAGQLGYTPSAQA